MLKLGVMNEAPDKLKPEEMPAFPLHNGDVWGGMALRDYLAAAAIQGICANPDCEPEDVTHNAIVAYRNADAMLIARMP